MIRFDSLPADMQSLIFDFVGRDEANIPEILPSLIVRISDIPIVPLDEFDRGSAYARRLNPDNAPPLIVADNHFLDGKHRCFSFRELGVESFVAIDLTGLAEPGMVEMNSLGELADRRERHLETSAKRQRRPIALEDETSGPSM